MTAEPVLPRVPPGSFAARIGWALLEAARAAEERLSAEGLTAEDRARAEGARATAVGLGMTFIALITMEPPAASGVVPFPRRRQA